MVWLDEAQVPLVRAVCELGKHPSGGPDAPGFDVIAAGSSQLGRSRELAGAFGPDVQPVDDIRTALTNPDAAAILLCAPGEFASGLTAAAGARAADDAGVLADCRARGVPVFSFEPMPSSLLQLDTPSLVPPEEAGLVAIGPDSVGDAPLLATAAAAGAWQAWVEFCPLLRLSRPVRDAAELLEQIGPAQTVHVECWSGPGQGTLGARLFDAVDAVTSLLGAPDQVDAAYVSATSARGRGTHALPGESLRGLEGDMTVNLRFADGRAASIVCSSRAGRFNRTLTLIGDRGRLRIYDDGFVWITADGKTADSARDMTRVRGTLEDHFSHAVFNIADQLSRSLDPAVPKPQPTDLLRVLSTAGAALLSARTGESESPATLLRMARTG